MELLLHGYHSSLREGFEHGDNISSNQMNHVTGIQATKAQEALRELRLFHYMPSKAGTRGSRG